MALVSGRRSTLNPDAPLFIPAAFRQVEDFSPEWWQLVTTSTWYRDYWISQHEDEDGFYDNGENDMDNIDVADLLPESFDLDFGEDLFNANVDFDAKNEIQHFSPRTNSGFNKESQALSFLKSLDEKSPKMVADPPKYPAKPAKWVSPKCSPRNIHQPR